MTLQVLHPVPQNLDVCINGINNRLNLLHEEGLGNLTQVVQHELYNKAHSDQLLDRSPPLQNPFSGNSINEVVLNVIHYTP